MTGYFREILGRAAHQATVHYFEENSPILTKTDWTWEGLDDVTKELYCTEAIGVLEVLIEMKQFRSAMETIHTLTGPSQAQFDAVKQALLNMALEGEAST